MKIRDNGHILSKTVYIAIGVDMDGNKDILGLSVAKSEGSKFWLAVLTELKNRGIEDVFIACCDGLTGLPDAIAAVFPHTTVQLCIVHMIRNSLKYVAWKDYKAITRDLKKIYTATSEPAARDALDEFEAAWKPNTQPSLPYGDGIGITSCHSWPILPISAASSTPPTPSKRSIANP